MFSFKKENVRKFELGATLRDKITGFEGIAIGVASYITGCDQFCVQPKLKDGSFVESKWLDDNRLEVAGDDVVKLELEKDVGACCPAPTK